MTSAMPRSSIDKNDLDVISQRASHVESQKPQAIEIGPFRVFGLAQEDADFFTNFPEEKRKKVFRKVDVRLVPMLALLYLICHIDRANIGNAKIEGMVDDLGMTGVQYNTVLSICKPSQYIPSLSVSELTCAISQSSSLTSSSKFLAIFYSRSSSARPCILVS